MDEELKVQLLRKNTKALCAPKKGQNLENQPKKVKNYKTTKKEQNEKIPKKVQNRKKHKKIIKSKNTKNTSDIAGGGNGENDDQSEDEESDDEESDDEECDDEESEDEESEEEDGEDGVERVQRFQQLYRDL